MQSGGFTNFCKLFPQDAGNIRPRIGKVDNIWQGGGGGRKKKRRSRRKVCKVITGINYIILYYTIMDRDNIGVTAAEIKKFHK